MKAWSILAYAADADYYCPSCAGITYGFDPNVLNADSDVQDKEGNILTPVFATSEDVHNEHCCICHELLD